MNFSKLFLLGALLVYCTALLGQSRSSLETKRKQLNQQIQNTSFLLNKTSASKKATLQEYNVLNTQMQSREELIKVIRQELNLIEDSTARKNEVVKVLEEEIALLKEKYKRILVHLYHYKQQNNSLLFVLSAQNFNKSYQRQLYLKQLEKRRSEQAILIRKTLASLQEQISALQAQHQTKSLLLAEEVNQKTVLDKEFSEKDRMLQNLKKKESQLKEELVQKENTKKQLNQKIENIIRDQIAAAKSKTRSYPTTEPAKSQNYLPTTSSSDDKVIASDFKSLKGSLPFPVSGGVVVSRFGKQNHPIFEQVILNNNGIDIRTSANATVKAVHPGVVVSTFSIPGSGNAVLLKHGDFYTTYSNLSELAVKRGDTVARSQKLGIVGKDPNTGNYLLHFELWNGKNKENPETWLGH